MSLQQEYADATATLQRVVDAIEARILALPDNPRIKRLSPQAFIVSSKDLGDNWTVAYHDYKAQYRLVVEAISGTGFDRLARDHRSQAGTRHKRIARIPKLASRSGRVPGEFAEFRCTNGQRTT